MCHNHRGKQASALHNRPISYSDGCLAQTENMARLPKRHRQVTFEPAANTKRFSLPTGVPCTGPVVPGSVLVTVVIVVVVVVVAPLGSTSEPANCRPPLYLSLPFVCAFCSRGLCFDVWVQAYRRVSMRSRLGFSSNQIVKESPKQAQRTG